MLLKKTPKNGVCIQTLGKIYKRFTTVPFSFFSNIVFSIIFCVHIISRKYLLISSSKKSENLAKIILILTLRVFYLLYIVLEAKLCLCLIYSQYLKMDERPL